MNLYKRSNGYYYIKYLDSYGREIRVSTKCKKKKDALSFVSNYKKELTRSFRTQRNFLNHYIELYLKYCKSRHSSKYHSLMRYTLELFSNYYNNPHIESIDSSLCEEFITRKYSNAKYLGNQFYRNLRTFFNWAVKNKYLNESPMSLLKPPKVSRKNPEWLKECELDMILEHVENKELTSIYTLLFYTGLRANELLSLTWSNIDLTNRIIYIRNNEKFTTKTNTEKTIPINEKANCILKGLTDIRRDQLIFSKNGRKYNVDHVSKAFKKAVRKTNLNQNIHLHSLRHSFASNLVVNGASLYLVSKLLGHARISTTEKYSHVKLDDLRETTELI
jgi:site-specific recombinase XerD